MSLITRVQAIETVAKHFAARFTDGRFGHDFHEALVHALEELGVLKLEAAAPIAEVKAEASELIDVAKSNANAGLEKLADVAEQAMAHAEPAAAPVADAASSAGLAAVEGALQPASEPTATAATQG